MVQEVEPQDDLQAGDIFAARYCIKKLLGEGDRKKTYLAEDQLVGDRLVALSVVKPHAAQLDTDGTRREANLLSKVGNHSHIVALHDRSLPDSPVEYLVFEYLPGGTLADLIETAAAQHQMPPAELVVRVGRQLAGAIAHMHAARLIHRDVAPHNIWLTSQGSKYKVKLGDFDSAVLLDEMPEIRPVTSDGYSSPEERQGGKLDERSDLYSLGGVLISLARAQLQFDRPDDLRRERPDFPPALTELLVSLVAHEADDRPASAEEVLGRLRTAGDSLDLYSIVASGEGTRVEFKSSFRFPRKPRYDLMTPEQRDKRLKETIPEVEKEVLLTIAAFLNSDGGTLLIGVGDDGTIVGIEDDLPTLPGSNKDFDGWQRFLMERVSHGLDVSVSALLHLTPAPTESGTVVRIDVSPRNKETWLTLGGQQEFYVRAASTSRKLPPAEAVGYIRDHWYS